MKSLNKQEGGDHYKDQAIQPVEFIQKNNIGFMEGNVIKYVCRHHMKNGVEDINKAIHYLEMLRDLQYPEKPDENQMEMEFDVCPIKGVDINVTELQVGDKFANRNIMARVEAVKVDIRTTRITKEGGDILVLSNSFNVKLYERKEPREEPEQSR